MTSTIIDTDVLIDLSRNEKTSVQNVANLEAKSKLLISATTEMELIVGCRNKTDLRELTKFLRRFEVIQITEQISERATELLREYKLSHGLLIPDALIAATALTLDENLITRNQRDFRFIKRLKLQAYPLI